MNVFKNLEPSKHADSIYYADLFIINNKVWMITGTGKSKAAQLASNSEKNADIARDSVALIRKSNLLFGRYDLGAIRTEPEIQNTLHKPYKIDFIAHCFSEEETRNFNLIQDKISDINNIDLALMLSKFPYTGGMAHYFFSPEEVSSFSNSERRLNQFIDLTTGVNETEFLAVPWMASLEDKASLYIEFEQNSVTSWSNPNG